MNGSPSGRRDGRRTGLGAIAGVLAAATALGVGQLVAGVTGANGSPVVAVGQLQIDFTPPWLKNFAITEFGSDDKLVLVSGILVVVAIWAVGLIAAATRPTATAADVLPTLAATAAAAVALRVLIDRIGPPAVAGSPSLKYEWDTGPACRPPRSARPIPFQMTRQTTRVSRSSPTCLPGLASRPARAGPGLRAE
jgi:hypothetical protein